MPAEEKKYPFLKSSTIEKESINLLNAFNKKIGKKLAAPVPVFDIIEYLGYDVDLGKMVYIRTIIFLVEL